MSLQTAGFKKMGEFLDNKYIIPTYQRDYAWKNQELMDFWLDLDKLATKRSYSDTHFFGQIVIHHDQQTDEKYIVDGQQRTITSIIFLKVLSLYIESLYTETGDKTASYICSDIEKDLIGRINDYHIKLGTRDSVFFENNILGKKVSRDMRGENTSQDLMLNAYRFFDKRFKELLNDLNPNDKVSLLSNLYETFKKGFRVLYMEASTFSEAYDIFETLNTRGKDLNTADLLKNHLFKKTHNSNFQMEQYWSQIVTTLDTTSSTDYIRCLFNSKSPQFLRTKGLYQSISVHLQTEKECEDFAKLLKDYAPYYRCMDYPDSNIGFTDKNVIRTLKYLKNLGAKIYQPIILAMLQRKYEEKEIAIALKSLETLFFRNCTILGRTSNSLEGKLKKIAFNIYSGDLDNISEIQKQILNLSVDFKTFSYAFRNFSTDNKSVIRYIFIKIHNYLDSTNEINLDTSEVHIEHILPQNPNEDWTISKAVHEECLWMLGNLCLLDGNFNIEMSNSSFSNKKTYYIKSKIEPNKQICEYDQWTKKEIRNRQKNLLDYAKKIWEV